MDVDGVDAEEVALFLACSMNQEEIDKEGLTNVVHKRTEARGPSKEKDDWKSGKMCH